MPPPDVLALAASLYEEGRPCALVTVVWRRGPSSGRPGAKAVILPDGTIRGWLGGACAESTVVREALEALTDGRCRLLFLGPPEEVGERRGVVSIPMACESEGAMEVHVEPLIPPPLLVIIGRSPAVRVTTAMAKALGWRAVVVDDGGTASEHPEADEVLPTLDLSGVAIDERSAIVVATQGHYDDQALEAALATAAGYIGLIASRKRASTVLEFLRDRRVPDEALARIHAPAGLDLGPIAHEEMALAILGEIVALKAQGGVAPGVVVHHPEVAIDPVCAMTVDIATAHYRTEHEGRTYYFCAPGCQRAFESDPAQFITTGGVAT
jgi:xanthine dehydrogenase accessory factor